MEFIEIVVIISCVLIVGGVIASSIINKKKGKTSCGCNCSVCKNCSCAIKKDDEKQNTQL